MLSHYLMVVVWTVCCDVIQWLTPVIRFLNSFGTCRDDFWFGLELLQCTEMHPLGIDQFPLVLSSSLRGSWSHTNLPPAHRCTGWNTWQPPYAWCSYIQFLVALTSFALGMLSAPTPGGLAVTCVGIHIIVCWVHLSFHLQVHCALFSTYAGWICWQSLPMCTQSLISGYYCRKGSALQGASQQDFQYGNLLQ